MSTTTDQNSPTAYLEHRPVLGRRQGRLLGIAGPLCMAILGAWLAGGGWTQRFEGITIDWRFRARGPRQPPANVVIVEIDEESRRNLRPDGVAFSLR